MLFSLLSLVLLRSHPSFRAGSQYAEGSQGPSHLCWPLSPKHHLPHPVCENLLPGQITSSSEPCSVLSVGSTRCHGISLDCKLLEVRNGVLALGTPAVLSTVPREGNEHLLIRVINKFHPSNLPHYLFSECLLCTKQHVPAY